MALQILENNGTFHLSGNLNATTSRAFIIHFEHVINSFKKVTVNIEKVKEIDTNGVAAFKTLLANALRENKLFSVIGNGCKDIYNEFNHSQMA
ncbi:STAS domain-containing protein [uncultured Lacinutrix sp.]|uniref:STAS domain-containing protein n=1 Tax=uncultured Lacinutrix sp. TaxID=574032 RepID=UPI00260E7135|nr:STAS domain-containing protein [uncultured Lacinutrix sp.]